MSVGSSAPFYAVSIVAGSDSDVWVTGASETDAPEAWHYDGTAWTDQSPGLSSDAEITAAALGSNGTLYVVGGNGATGAGMVWSYDGSRWADVSPADPPHQYNAVAVTPAGAVVAAGGANDGALQERSGTTWTTISLSQPINIITGVSVAPGGTVYGVGQGTANQPVLIEQQPGSHSAAVLDAPAAKPGTAVTVEMGVVADGQGDVWLLGMYLPDNGNSYYPWITHFNGSEFTPGFSSGDYAIAGGASLGSAVLAYGGAEDSDGNLAPKLLAVCPVQVGSTTITPSPYRTAIASQIFWSSAAEGAPRHKLVVAGLFNSGAFSAGGSFAYSFFAAATYTVKDTSTGAVETVRVPPAVTPASGDANTVFSIAAANIQAPARYAYRVLVERPGTSRYTLLTRTGQPTTNYIPDDGPGTYKFESELRTPAGITAPSPPVAITVSLPGARRCLSAADAVTTRRLLPQRRLG